jgi:hypothetical protein
MKLNELVNQLGASDTVADLKKRYNGATGTQAAQKATTQRVTKQNLMDLNNKERTLDTLINQIDTSFKTILMAANNVPCEQFVISQLNQVKERLNRRITQDKEREARLAK